MKAEFYKMDFRAWNIGTVDLTLEQEAAYLRLCHAVYDAHGPVPNSVRLLCSLWRCGNAKAAALLRALIEAGKIQVTTDGKLTNRRAVIELANRAEVSAKRSEAGERGGRVSRRGPAQGGSDSGVSPEWLPSDIGPTAECPPTDAGVNAANPLKSHNVPEANASTQISRLEEIRGDAPIVPKGTEPDRFPEFRAAYPKRNTAFPVTAARKRWLEAIRRGADPAAIIAGSKGYAAEQARIGKLGTEYVKTADAWLHQGRWADHASPAEPSMPAASTVSDDKWRDRVRAWRDRGGYWPWTGPQPDQPGTLVPAAVLAEFGLSADRAA